MAAPQMQTVEYIPVANDIAAGVSGRSWTDAKQDHAVELHPVNPMTRPGTSWLRLIHSPSRGPIAGLYRQDD